MREQRLSGGRMRIGGTIHPIENTGISPGDELDLSTGELEAPDAIAGSYLLSDRQSDRYKELTAADVVDIVHRRGLKYSQRTQTGVAFHMLSLLSSYGKVGLTCIANS